MLRKAACGVPVFIGVQGFESAKAHLIRKSRLRLPVSDLVLRATRGMVQTAFSVFSKGKEISFLTWSSALPPVSQSADSLFLRLWLLPLSAPGSGRTQSPGNPSVAALKQKNTMLLHDAFSRIAETGFEDYPLRKRKGTPIIQLLYETSSQQEKNTTHLRVWCLFLELRRQDLNLRPPGYEPDELPDCSTPRQY